MVFRTHKIHYTLSILVTFIGALLSNYKPFPSAIALLIVIIGLFYFLHTLNTRIEVNQETIKVGYFLTQTMILKDILEIRPREFFLGQSSPILLIQSKDKTIRISTRAFETNDLYQLKKLITPQHDQILRRT